MLYTLRKPSPPLSSLVHVLWCYEGYAQPQGKERLMPDGSVELVFNLDDDRIVTYEATPPFAARTFPGAVVCGPHSEAFVIDTTDVHVIGVHFTHGGAHAFFEPPLSKLRNRDVALEDLWGADANRFREALAEAPTADAKLERLELLLRRRLVTARVEDHPLQYAVSRLSSARVPPVRAVVDEIGATPGRFIRQFEQRVGLTPKVFARVMRFQRLLRRVHRARRIDWTETALSCGYYDHSHCINEFRSLAGLTPCEYFALKTEHLNHVPLVEE